MSSEEDSFAEMKHRLGLDDAAPAAEAIVQRFASRLAAFAATKMSERLRRRVGPEDIVQSVFATFFRRLDDDRLEIRDWDSLWGLLAQIAVCRISRHAERNRKPPRGNQSRCEVGLETGIDALDRDVRPEEAVMTAELCEKLVDGLTEKYRPIVEGILQGTTHEALAAELGTSLSTVDRVHRRGRRSDFEDCSRRRTTPHERC